MMAASGAPEGGRVPRRKFIAGMGAAAIAVPAGQALAAAQPAEAAGGPGAGESATGPGGSPFPPVPSADTTTNEDRMQMLWQLGITVPDMPPRAQDPNRPPNATPVDPTNTEGNWTDPLGHFVTRGGFGQWITYDDSAGAAGGAQSPFGDFGPFSSPRYPDIPLLATKSGRPVTTPEDWWVRRRPEIVDDVHNILYGEIPPRELWPAITWSVGPTTTGTANGVDFAQRVITGTLDLSRFPQVRNVPVVQGTLRTPLAAQGQPVPVIIVFGGNNSEWQFTSPFGYGVCAFNWAALQPDTGGADLSSWLIGLVSQGNWRRPQDWGALAAWSWGISRLIDFFETDPDVDATRIGLQGHSRFGKATLVAAAYDQRIGAAFPSAAGQCGTSWARRTWGENLELVAGADTEYHWIAGNAMRFCGELRPGQYWPRKVWNLPVDVHSVMSLVAPRVLMTNAGEDIPPGFGDAWTDPRGEFLSGAVASQVWNLLGWPGMIIGQGTVFTSGPGESIGGTPPVDVAFIDGTIGWRRHHEGHTPVPDWPSFMTLTARHFNDTRPVIAPGQRFRVGHGGMGHSGMGHGRVVGTIAATGSGLGNWQVTGGTGVGRFAVNRDTGQITLAHGHPGSRPTYTLTVVVDDQKLTSSETTVVIETH